MLLAAASAFAGAARDATRDLETAVSNNPRQAIEEANQRLLLAQRKADRPAQLMALRLLAMAHDQVDDNPGLREDAQRGALLARELGDMEALGEFIAASAAVAFNDGRYPDAIALYDQAIALAEQYHLERSRAKFYVGKAHMYHGLERSSDALALLMNVYALFESQQDKLWMANTLSEIANVYGRDGASNDDLHRAIAYHQRAADLIDPGVNRFEFTTHYHNIGLVYSRLKDYVKARSYFEKGLLLARELKDPNTIAFLNFRLGVVAKEERRLNAALANFDHARPVFMESGKVSMLFLTHLGRAEVLAALKQRNESLEALASAQEIALRLGSPKRDTQYFSTAAGVYALLGEFQQAYRQMGALRDAQRRRDEAVNVKMAVELQTHFDMQQREGENALLRAQQRESEARRLALILALVLSLTVLGALAFYLVRQAYGNRRFVNLAMRDDLTGLPNRRSILEFGRLQLRSRRAGDKGLCVALIDLDHFKAINDDFGHDVGDAVLIAFAAASQEQLRTNDRIGRFGGEEFLLVMPGSDAGQIPAVFERLRTAVHRLEAAGFPRERALTFSMGGAWAGGGEDTLDSLIKRADEALYRAKQAGRDRYEIA